MMKTHTRCPEDGSKHAFLTVATWGSGSEGKCFDRNLKCSHSELLAGSQFCVLINIDMANYFLIVFLCVMSKYGHWFASASAVVIWVYVRMDICLCPSPTGILQILLFVLWILQQWANYWTAAVQTPSVIPAGGCRPLWIQPDGCH